jgi:hypothetical protein
MANLDPQVQVKLIEISEKWTEKAGTNTTYNSMPKVYPKEFDTIYKQLVKTVSEK